MVDRIYISLQRKGEKSHIDIFTIGVYGFGGGGMESWEVGVFSPIGRNGVERGVYIIHIF